VLDQETDRVLSAIQERTIGTNPHIAVKDILAAEIPYPIKTFFRADVELTLLDELHRFWKTSRFHFNRPDVQQFQQQANSILILHYTFDRAEYIRRLEDVVHMTANFLIRPQWTMKSVLFEHDESVATHGLLRLLRYFGSYDYLKDMIIRYAQERNISTFRLEDFSTFLWKADGEFLRRKTGDELARVLTPMFEFFRYPNRETDSVLPTPAFIKYFDDKGLSSVTVRLEGEAAQNKAAFSQRELRSLLEDLRRSAGSFVVERPEHDVNRPPPHPSEPPPPPESVSTATIPTIPQPPLANFLESIGEDERKKFVKKIFRQDESSFLTAIEFIGGITTWKEASRFIDEIFIENNIDPYSSEAVRFMDVVFRKFHPKSS